MVSDHTLSVARLVEGLLGEISCTEDCSQAFDLARRAIEAITALQSPTRGRLSERVEDALRERLERDEIQTSDRPAEATGVGLNQAAPHAAPRRSEMPRVSDVYKSAYLRAADLEEPVTVTIKSAAIEELGEDRDEKIVVTFKELDRGLVLNRTNADYLSMICGSDDTDAWAGHRVGLFVQPVAFKGKLVDSIRVTKPQHLKAADDMAKSAAAKAPRKKKAAAVAADADDDMDDEIPALGKK